MEGDLFYPLAIPEKEFMIIPNALFDIVFPTLTASEWAILCFILRKTRGFQKEYDKISYSQIIGGTPIKSKGTVSRCIKSLQERRLILKTTDDLGQCYYKPNANFAIKVVDAEPEETASAVQNLDTPVQNLNDPVQNLNDPVQNLDTQNTSLKTSLKTKECEPPLKESEEELRKSLEQMSNDAANYAKACVEYANKTSPSMDALNSYPADVRNTIECFHKIWRIPIPRKSRNDYKKWIEDARDIRNMIIDSGYKVEDIMDKTKQYISTPEGATKPVTGYYRFDVYDIGSIMKATGVVISRLLSGEDLSYSGERLVTYDADGNEIVWNTDGL